LGFASWLGGKAGGNHVSFGASEAVAVSAPVTVESVQREPGLPPADATGARSRMSPDSWFWLGVASAVALGATARFVYLSHGAPAFVGGDGFDYHLSALRLADGLGYTSAFGDVGAETAHHPPGWVTVLTAVTWAGGRSMWVHQVTGLIIGLGVIVLAGLVGRRYVGRRVGIVAAVLAAAYPGFWVLDVQILSEPLGLVVTGLLMLVLADLWERPTLTRAIFAGAAAGALALIRSEQLALVVLGVFPILLFNRRVMLRQRLAWTAVAGVTTVVLIAPWAVHNLGRFEEPVLLSTNGGTTLLQGNCRTTYGGELMGSFDPNCAFALALRNPDLDRSQRDVEARRVAMDNMRDNLDRLPATVLARYGRLLAVFRPSHTVGLDAGWLNVASWPVWAWVSSFWVVVPLAVYGSMRMRRSRCFQWPLVAPAVIVLLVGAVVFGDPRYHTLADLGLVVLSAVALDHLFRRFVTSRGLRP
jgi:hypothetical protein